MSATNASHITVLITRQLLRSLYVSSKRGVLKRIYHFICHGHLFRKYHIRKYMQGKSSRKLQIGGGLHTLEGWINADLIAGDIYFNAAKKFPFPAESVDLIFAEQFIEHLDFEEGLLCLRECYRVLKKGGNIRLSTPDLEALCSLYENQNPDVDLNIAMDRHRTQHNKELTTSCHFLNDFFRLWNHSFIYDEKTLRMRMDEVGFSNISRHKFGCSNEKALAALERHADVEWMKNAFQLILEAEKI